MGLDSSSEDTKAVAAEHSEQEPGQVSSLPPHIQPDPRPPITQLDHQPRHHKRVIMLVTIAVVVILIAVAVGYYLGTSASKHTW